MVEIRNLVPGVFISGALLLIILATGIKDPLQTEYNTLITWIKSDYPGLIDEEQIFEIYPELEKIKEGIKKREILKTRYYDCLRNPCRTYLIKNDQMLTQYSKKLAELQDQIERDLEIFLRRHHISSHNY